MKKYLFLLIFLLITLAIMLPLYQPGFVFLLDMVFTPQLNLADYLTDHNIPASFPLILIIKLLSYVLPLEIIQKIILSLILFLPGFLMYWLAKLFLPKKWALLSGIFYMINPWVYERFLAGQWLVLLGYAFFPLLIKLFWQLLQVGHKKDFIKFVILFSIYPIINLHWAYIFILFLIILFAVYLITHKQKISSVLSHLKALSHLPPEVDPSPTDQRPPLAEKVGATSLRKILIYFLVSLLFFFLVNSFWLVNFFNSSNTFSKIELNDFRAYKTQGDPAWGPYFNVSSLYGFWHQDFLLPKDFLNYWWLLTFLILFLSILGVYESFKKKNILGITLSLVCLPIVLIAVGYGHSLTQPLIKFLYYVLPGFKGLRETEKIVGLLAFSYALILPLGAKSLMDFIKIKTFASPLLNKEGTQGRLINFRSLLHLPLSRGGHIGSKAKFLKISRWQIIPTTLYITLLIIPLLITNSIFWGFNGQIKTSNYPDSWSQVNQVLKEDKKTKKVLFLPWHGYLRFSFTQAKKISNPASGFFGKNIVAGKNIDNVYLLERDQGIWDQKMFCLLSSLETFDENLDFFKSEGMRYIILVKEADFERYKFLDESRQLKKALDFDDLVLYVIPPKIIPTPFRED